MAEVRFPVEVQDDLDINNVDFPSREQLLREGRTTLQQLPIISASLVGTNSNFGDNLASLSVNVVPGRAALITGVSASCSGPAQVYSASTTIVKNLTAVTGTSGTAVNVVFGANGGTYQEPCNMLVGSEGAYSFSIKYLGVSPSQRPYVAGKIETIDFTADYNFKAKRMIMVIGESTSWSAMENDANGIAYAGEKLWGFQLVNKMKLAGKSVRLVNKAFGQMSSNHMEYARRSNYFDCDYDAIFVNLGQNDCVNTSSGLSVVTPQATFKANLANIIAMRNANRPNAPVIFVSCFPTDVAAITNYRTWMQQVSQDTSVGGGTINNVWFIDGSTSFTLNPTATADLNFSISNRIANGRVHYSGEGQGLNATNVFNAIQSMDWYTDF